METGRLEGEPNLEGGTRVWGWGINPERYNPGSQVLLVCATKPWTSHRISCLVTLNHGLVGNVLWGLRLAVKEDRVRVYHLPARCPFRPFARIFQIQTNVVGPLVS